MGLPFHKKIPDISSLLYDDSKTSTVSPFVTSLLNMKMTYGLTGKDYNVTVSSDGKTFTVNYTTGYKEVLKIAETSSAITYTISVYNETNTLLGETVSTRNKTTNAISNSITYDAITNGVPSFNDVTWSQVNSLMIHHYKKELDLTKYWHVGDTKILHHDDILNAQGDVEYSANDVRIVILDINHDTLSSDNGNAAFTIGVVNSIGVGCVSNTVGNGWEDSSRRTWCNKPFIESLPLQLQDTIKTVSKSIHAVGGSAIKTVYDKVFLLSESEIIGTTGLKGSGTEGTQYSYFTNKSLIAKCANDNSSEKIIYATRTLSSTSNGNKFICINKTGGSDTVDTTDKTIGIVPAFCL